METKPQIGTCPHCGAPIYSDGEWHDKTPPEVIYSCECRFNVPWAWPFNPVPYYPEPYVPGEPIGPDYPGFYGDRYWHYYETKDGTGP